MEGGDGESGDGDCQWMVSGHRREGMVKVEMVTVSGWGVGIGGRDVRVGMG